MIHETQDVNHQNQNRALFSFKLQFNPLSNDWIEPGVCLVPSAFHTSGASEHKYLLTRVVSLL